jgi:hypothetical protein
MWALRVLRYRPPDAALARLSRRAAALAARGDLDVRERANVLQAFALLGCPLPG